MTKYIDADALLEKVWDADTRIGYVQVVDVGDIQDAPAADVAEVVQTAWISVKDRLPDAHDEKYLCHYRYGKGNIYFTSVLDWYGTDGKPHFQYEGCNGMKVTHWMPLPEPPKEEA